MDTTDVSEYINYANKIPLEHTVFVSNFSIFERFYQELFNKNIGKGLLGHPVVKMHHLIIFIGPKDAEFHSKQLFLWQLTLKMRLL
jgi:hypothetical protein